MSKARKKARIKREGHTCYLVSQIVSGSSYPKRLYARMKISVITDISVIRFYGYIGYIGDIFGYIGDISVDIIGRLKIVKNSWKCKKNLIII